MSCGAVPVKTTYRCVEHFLGVADESKLVACFCRAATLLQVQENTFQVQQTEGSIMVMGFGIITMNTSTMVCLKLSVLSVLCNGAVVIC